MTLLRLVPVYLLAIAAIGAAVLIPLGSSPRALATCGDPSTVSIEDSVYQGCSEGSSAIGAAPGAGAIIACRDVPGCLSASVNSPGGVSVPHRSTAVHN